MWYDNLDKIVEDSDKYEVKTTRDYIILKINYLALADSGNYTLKALDSVYSTEKHFELIVLGMLRKAIRRKKIVNS